MTAKLVSIERRTADGQRRPVTLLDERRAVTARNDAKAARVEAEHQDALRRIDDSDLRYRKNDIATHPLSPSRLDTDTANLVRGLVTIAIAMLAMAMLSLIWDELK